MTKRYLLVENYPEVGDDEPYMLVYIDHIKMTTFDTIPEINTYTNKIWGKRLAYFLKKRENSGESYNDRYEWAENKASLWRTEIYDLQDTNDNGTAKWTEI